MRAYVVYESLWGNTAAVAKAVAEGLGEGAIALSTQAATYETIADADIIIAGSPSHMNGMPSQSSREEALSRSNEEGGPPEPDLGHPPMRRWLEDLPSGSGPSASFDTRMDSWWATGPTKKIARRLRARGLNTLDSEGFIVEHEGETPRLAKGELDRARTWGKRLANEIGS